MRRIGSQQSLPAAVERIALLALVCGAVLLSERTPLFQDFSWRAFDQLAVWVQWPAASSEIVVVDFDDDSAAQYKTFPIPRAAVAQAIRKVASGNAAFIGLDMLLTEPRAEGDAEMSAALRSAGNVVIASVMGSPRLPPLPPLPQFCDPDPQDPGFCRAGAFAVGFADMPADADGFVRRMYLLPRRGYSFLPFAVVLATNFRGQPLQQDAKGQPTFGGHPVPLDDNGLNTYTLGVWAPQVPSRISARQLLSDQFDPRALRGKLVLIGQSNEMARDRHFSPMFRLRRADGSPVMISGTDLQALAISTLLQGRAVRALQTWRSWLLVILVAALIIAAGSSWSPLKTCVTAAAILMALIAGAVWALGSRALWVDFVPCVTAALVALPATFGWRFVKEHWLAAASELQRQQLMSIFSRYVSPAVAEQIWERRDEIVLAGEERMATVLFSDIRSFTALSAGKPSAEVLAWLNEYFNEMGAVVSKNGGFLNKFIGDGLMAVYGVPLSAGPAQDACGAVRTAIEMLARVEELNRRHAGDPAWPTLRIGVGIHSGLVTAGSVGASDRLEYSVIGETVNLASRLETATKEAHASIVMSGDTQRLICDSMDTIPLGEASIRGFETPIALYTVDAARSKAPAGSAASAGNS